MKEKKETVLIPTTQPVSQEEIEIVQMVADEITREDIAKKKHIDKREVQKILDELRMRFSKKGVEGLITIFFRNGLIK